MRSLAGMLAISLAVIAASSPARATPSLISSIDEPAVGETVTFDYNGIAGKPGPLIIRFGDGTTAVLPGQSGVIAHAYRSIGDYIVELCEAVCNARGFLASTGVLVRAPAPAIPFGTILGSTLEGAPFLAGADARIAITFRIASQPLVFATTPEIDLQAIVDLEDMRGDLIRRSDPFAIPFSSVEGDVVAQQTIPYTVPADAKGSYLVRVYLRTDSGGTVAVGPDMKMVVFGGPDPGPVVSNQFHASGSLIAGPSTTTNGAGGSASTTQFQSDLTTALEWPTQTLSLSGLYDPVSRRSDPVIELTSASPGPISAPDALPASPTPGPVPSPAGSAESSSASMPKYADILGRATSSLPSLLGGGDTLRGLDFTNAYPDGWTYHGAAGYTQLGSPTTSLQSGGLLDVTRSWGETGAESLRLTYFGDADDAAHFVPDGGPGPMSAQATVLQFTGQLLKDVSAQLSAGASNARVDIPGESWTPDAADKAGLQYSLGTVNVAANYVNYGPDFATGGGPGAVSDMAGPSATATANISPVSTVSLGWNLADKRSVFSRSVNESAAFATQPPDGFGLQLTVTHVHVLVAGSDLTADTLAYGVNRSWNNGASLALNGTASSSADALQSDKDGAVRTDNLTYSLQRGSQIIGAGISTNVVAGAAANATVSENVVYGFGFGQQRGGMQLYELQLSAMGGNATGAGQAGRESMYSAILSRHLSRQAAFGLRIESGDMANPIVGSTTRTSAVQLQLNLNY